MPCCWSGGTEMAGEVGFQARYPGAALSGLESPQPQRESKGSKEDVIPEWAESERPVLSTPVPNGHGNERDSKRRQRTKVLAEATDSECYGPLHSEIHE